MLLSGLGGVFKPPRNAASKRRCASRLSYSSAGVALDKFFAITDISSLSFDVPTETEQQIGAAIIAFSRLEHQIELMIWDFLKVGSDSGRLLTGHMEFSVKQQLLKKLIEQNANASLTKPIWRAVTVAMQNRNKVCHAVWITVKGHPAMVSSQWDSHPGHIAVERFKQDRLLALARLSNRLEKVFKTFSDQIGLRHGQPTEQWHGVFQRHVPPPR
jgi:hypothetical protein